MHRFQRNKLSAYTIIIIVTILFSVACIYAVETTKPQPKLSNAALKELALRKKNYYEEKLRFCLNEIQEKASQMVDSVIIEQALFIGADTLTKPIRPIRPMPENFIPPNQNVPLKPFLKRSELRNFFHLRDSIRRDSISRDSIRLDSLGILNLNK